MSHCACSFLRGLWSFLMGSLRMILFFSNLILLVLATLSTMILFQISRNGTIDLLPKTFIQLEVVAISVFSMLIAIVAVYGSFYRHAPSLKVFMVLSSLNILFVAAVIISSSGGSLEREYVKYLDELRHRQIYYDWNNSEPSDALKRETTHIWDNLQSSFCCGIEGPQDWDAHRPGSLPPDTYPRSCCAPDSNFVPVPEDSNNRPGPQCRDGPTLYRVGCHERIHNFERILFGYGLFLMVVQLVMSIVSSCVYHHVSSRTDAQHDVEKLSYPDLRNVQ